MFVGRDGLGQTRIGTSECGFKVGQSHYGLPRTDISHHKGVL